MVKNMKNEFVRIQYCGKNNGLTGKTKQNTKLLTRNILGISCGTQINNRVEI